MQQTRESTTLAEVTIDQFLVLALSEAHLTKFTHTLRLKYRVTDLEPRTSYLGWKISINGYRAIQASQLSHIAKESERASLRDPNPCTFLLPKSPYLIPQPKGPRSPKQTD